MVLMTPFSQNATTSLKKNTVHEHNQTNNFPSNCFKEVLLFLDLFLTSLLAGTDGPAELSAGGLWARGEEGLSFPSTSVVTTSTVSSSCIGVSGENTEERSVSETWCIKSILCICEQHNSTLATVLYLFKLAVKSACGSWWIAKESVFLSFFSRLKTVLISKMDGKLWGSHAYTQITVSLLGTSSLSTKWR